MLQSRKGEERRRGSEFFHVLEKKIVMSVGEWVNGMVVILKLTQGYYSNFTKLMGRPWPCPVHTWLRHCL
jgi:hypothetical protein